MYLGKTERKLTKRQRKVLRAALRAAPNEMVQRSLKDGFRQVVGLATYMGKPPEFSIIPADVQNGTRERVVKTSPGIPFVRVVMV